MNGGGNGGKANGLSQNIADSFVHTTEKSAHAAERLCRHQRESVKESRAGTTCLETEEEDFLAWHDGKSRECLLYEEEARKKGECNENGSRRRRRRFFQPRHVHGMRYNVGAKKDGSKQEKGLFILAVVVKYTVYCSNRTLLKSYESF